MREAGDVLKKMADIDPADLKIRSKLADLYTRDGDHGEGGRASTSPSRRS